MSKEIHIEAQNKTEMYALLEEQIEQLIMDDTYLISSLSNITAVLMDTMKGINWVGFYLKKEDVLYLGPFQGKLACVEIKVGKGVCGTAVKEDKIQRVEDVHTFAGHIACDGDTNSEIVLPIHSNGEIIAVLDIDSPQYKRFDEMDEEGLAKIVKVMERNLKSLF